MRTKSFWIMPSVIHARRLPMHSWQKQREPDKQFDAEGNDVTVVANVMEAQRVVDDHNAMLGDLGLGPEATQAEINEAKAKKGREIEYEHAQEVIAEHERRVGEQGEPEPEPITLEDTRKYEEAKAIVAAHEALAQAPTAEQQPAEKPERSGYR
jgi:hypothetical protein